MVWWTLGGLLVGALAFVLLTDGRYGGRPLMRWIYDRCGPRLFALQGEAARWDALFDELGFTDSGRLLDVGTALGDLPLTLAARPRFAGEAVGLEASPRMVAAAQARARQRGLTARARFVEADATRPLPFPAKRFDAVVCLGLLETVSHPERVLGECARVLAPGGALVVSVYTGWSARLAALSAAWYRRRLAPLGFAEVRQRPCRRNQDVLIARRPA